MAWSLEKILKISDPSVKDRLVREWFGPRFRPITGDLNYWSRIVHNSQVDYRKRPYLYESGRGHQGVMSVEPYKTEVLPFYDISDATEAFASALSIFEMYEDYVSQDDFVGCDICRKFLSMGRMRCQYFANQIVKRSKDKNLTPKQSMRFEDRQDASMIFQAFHHQLRDDPRFINLKKAHLKIGARLRFLTERENL